MLIQGRNKMEYINKKDIDQLWELHLKNSLYIFDEIRNCSSKEDLLNNFYNYFGKKRNYTLKKNEQIIGLCSLNQIIWKNRSCSISYQLLAPEYGNYFTDQFRSFFTFLKDDLNIITIRLILDEFQLNELRQLKINFQMEGKLREHKFSSGKFHDVHIITINQHESQPVNQPKQQN